MKQQLDGKVCVITGGASGMGRATALRFLEAGACAVIADINDRMGEETLTLAAEPERMRYVHTDVSRETDIEAMIALAVREFGGLDVLMNNAGAPVTHAPLTDITVADFDTTVAINFRSAWLGIKHAGRRFKVQAEAGNGGGCIINVASAAALTQLGPPIYACSKAALIQLTEEAARQLSPLGIRVNTISPGAFPTTMYGAPAAELEPFLSKAQLLPLAGDPADIAEMALFLASNSARFITGGNFVVDGGLVAGGTQNFYAAMSAFRSSRSAG